MIAVWTGEEGEHPKILQKLHGKLVALNDNWGIILNNHIVTQVLFQSKPQELKIPTSVISCVCNSQIGLFITSEGEVWGISSENLSAAILRKEVKKNTLVKIDGLCNITQASLGKTHAAALDRNGKLFTWGIGEDHQLGDLETTKHGPILVRNADYFTAEQVLCGEKSTLIRTQGGYIYIFGLLSNSERCFKLQKPKLCPYTLPDLETHYITSICCGKKFVAALTSGTIFVFDSCLKPVRLSLYQKEINSIAASETSLFGLEKGCLYQWVEGKGKSDCALKNWVLKVYLLEKGYFDCQIVSGYGKSVGIICSNPKGPIGKVIKSNNSFEEIEIFDSIDEEFIKSPKSTNENCLVYGNVDSNIETGISIFTDTLTKNIRLTFHRLAGKIDYNTWLSRFENVYTESSVRTFWEKIVPVFSTRLGWYFSGFKHLYSNKTYKILMKMMINFTKNAEKDWICMWRKNTRIRTPIQKNNLRCAILILNVANNKLLSKTQSSVFINLFRYKPIKPRNEFLVEVMKKIYKNKIEIFFSYFLWYVWELKVEAVKSILIMRIRKEEKIKCIRLMRCFALFKPVISSNGSYDSKKSSEFSNTSSSLRSRYNLKISSEGEIPKGMEFVNSPVMEKNLSTDQSPKTNLKQLLSKGVEKLFAKNIKPRNSSKPQVFEKIKNSEQKAKNVKKGYQYAEEIKTRQVKSKLLKLSSPIIKSYDREKSPKTPSILLNTKISSKFTQVFALIQMKIKQQYQMVFPLLKIKKSVISFSFAPDRSELLPIVAPEIWKLKVYILGINKLTLLTKKRLRKCGLSQLFS
ncbi:hypothetical protein SteCoe_10389 [Stentor coeruleus]|uniref:Uncharacterized protein n=1 Tax=Stentor coeruleus TaxID=5963 RepID=A0A1R2CFU1_9CILI|nr:hypothetical protein SteCoe_10389 [Stentor coeruleus]